MSTHGDDDIVALAWLDGDESQQWTLRLVPFDDDPFEAMLVWFAPDGRLLRDECLPTMPGPGCIEQAVCSLARYIGVATVSVERLRDEGSLYEVEIPPFVAQESNVRWIHN